jgi:hypothetical protein
VVTIGSAGRFIPDEKGQMTSITGVTVTGILKNSQIASTPFSFESGDIIDVTFSNTAPVTISFNYNKITSSKTTEQLVGLAANPTFGIGLSYGGVYSASDNQFYFARNTGSSTNSANGEIIDKDLKLFKELLFHTDFLPIKFNSLFVGGVVTLFPALIPPIYAEAIYPA